MNPSTVDTKMQFILFFISVAFNVYQTVEAQGYKPPVSHWQVQTLMALQKLKDELPEIKMPQDQGPNPYQDFVRTLTEAIEDHRSFFLKTQLDKTEEHVNLDVIGSIFEEEKDVVANKMKKNFIDSPTLDNFYNTQFLALKMLLNAMLMRRNPTMEDLRLMTTNYHWKECVRAYHPVVTQKWW